MKRLQKASLIVEMIDKMKERDGWAGETHLHKCLFFLQEMRGIPTDYEFLIYHYGPFSFDLSDEIVQLKGDNIIIPYPRPFPYAPSLACSEASHRLREYFPKTLKKYADDINFVANHFGNLNATELSKLATAYYFILKGEKDNCIDDDDDIARKVDQAVHYISVPDAKEATRKIRKIANSNKELICSEANISLELV